MDNSAAAIISCDEASYPPGHSFRRAAGFPHYTLGCLLAGKARKQTACAAYSYSGAAFMLTPPRTPYDFHAPVAHRELWFIFSAKPEWRPLLRWGMDTAGGEKPFVPGSGQRAARAIIIRHFREAIAHFRSPLPYAPRMAELSFEQALICLSNLAGRHGAIDGRIERVISRLRGAPSRRWDILSMAAVAGLSPSRFSHLFYREVGIAPAKFLEQTRFELAKSLLLSTERSIQEIAAAAGFHDPLHFSSRFRSIVGSSPSQFRRRG
ncbi:MAG: AraC family transcriptional regulator [Spirochaetota bacterium]